MKILTLSLFLVAVFSLTASAQDEAFLTSIVRNQLAKDFSLIEPGEHATVAYYQSDTTDYENSSGWNVDFTPYLWMAGLSGDVVVRGIAVREIDISFSDIIDKLDMSFAGHMEATKDNKFTLLFDINYMNVSDSPNVLIIRLKNTSAEIGATYHLNENFEVLGGARIVKYKLELTPRTGETFDDSRTFVDGFAGIRVSGRLAEAFKVSARGDIGGLASDFSWNIVLDGSLRFADWGSFYLAYRWWEIDYGSNDDNNFQVNVLTQGPILGLTFHF